MSALGGALGIGLALIAEEVFVTGKGGPTALAGFAKSAATIIDHLSDPTVAGIPDLTTAKAVAAPPTTTPALPGQPATTNPISSAPQPAGGVGWPGPQLPGRDYNPPPGGGYA